jgi:hypothetical protein
MSKEPRMLKSLTLCCLLGAASFVGLAQTLPDAPAKQPPATAKRKGTIRGRVVDESGEPVANVSLRLSSRGFEQWGSQLETKTDDNGAFQFTDLPDQSYRLSCWGDGVYVEPLELAGRRRYFIGEQINLALIKGGVISGRVTGAFGQPLVGVLVRAAHVRDTLGEPQVDAMPAGKPTDDRGQYRIYGLPPGGYHVFVNGEQGIMRLNQGRAFEVATYYPGAERTAAAEIEVQSGAEVTGIDIQHVGRLGHTLSGTLNGSVKTMTGRTETFVLVYLYDASGQLIAQSDGRADTGFVFNGLTDGTYEVRANSVSLDDNGSVSAPLRVQLNGASISGLQLKMLPLGSLAGQLETERPAPACHTRELAYDEVQIHTLLAVPKDSLWGGSYGGMKQALRGMLGQTAAPSPQFTLSDLPTGQQYLHFDLPPGWYAKAAKLKTKSAEIDVARQGFTLKQGERLSGLTVTLAAGAASMRGQVAVADSAPRQRLYVHLVPAEPAAAHEVLRYAETLTKAGQFAFENLAPGRYWLLTQAVGEQETVASTPVAWNETLRLKLRREAANAQTIELNPCQQVRDVVLRLK